MEISHHTPWPMDMGHTEPTIIYKGNIASIILLYQWNIEIFLITITYELIMYEAIRQYQP